MGWGMRPTSQKLGSVGRLSWAVPRPATIEVAPTSSGGLALKRLGPVLLPAKSGANTTARCGSTKTALGCNFGDRKARLGAIDAPNCAVGEFLRVCREF